MDELRKLITAHDPGDRDSSDRDSGDRDTGSDYGNGPLSDSSSPGDRESSYDSGSYEG